MKFNPRIVVVAGSQNGTLVDEFQMQYSIPNSGVLDEISIGIVNLEEPFQVLPVSCNSCVRKVTKTLAIYEFRLEVTTSLSISFHVLVGTTFDKLPIQG